MILSTQKIHRLLVGMVAVEYLLGAIAYAAPSFETFNLFKLGVVIGHLLTVGLSVLIPSTVWWHGALRTVFAWAASGPALLPIVQLAYVHATGGPPAVGFFPVEIFAALGGLTLVAPLCIQCALHVRRRKRATRSTSAYTRMETPSQ